MLEEKKVIHLLKKYFEKCHAFLLGFNIKYILLPFSLLFFSYQFNSLFCVEYIGNFKTAEEYKNFIYMNK